MANSTTGSGRGWLNSAALKGALAPGAGNLAAQPVDEALGFWLAFGSQPRQLIFFERQFAQKIVEVGGRAPMAGGEGAPAGCQLAADRCGCLVLRLSQVTERHFLPELL